MKSTIGFVATEKRIHWERPWECTKTMNSEINTKMDFVTIIFNNHIEVELLKVQAHSFAYVDESIIKNIIIVYNDIGDSTRNQKEQILKDVLFFYPARLREKVNIVSSDDFGLAAVRSNWYSQQVAKIMISTLVTTSHYVVLDGKNHFIRNVGLEYFFEDGLKPYLHLQEHGDDMMNFYNNCLNYFSVPCPYPNKRKIQTVTPFVFKTEVCIDLIGHINARENRTFPSFIMEEKKYTEFFFYYAYLLATSKINEYVISPSLRFIAVGRADPKIYEYNSFESKLSAINQNQNLCVMGLHRGAICYLDKEYKAKLVNLYRKYYCPCVVDFIKDKILNSDIPENTQYIWQNLPSDFEWQQYVSVNHDLRLMNEFQAKNHYNNQGYKENRKYKSDQ